MFYSLRIFHGLVIKNSISGVEIIQEDKDSVLVKAGAGEVWHDLVLFCVERKFGGIENLSLIPGTVGLRQCKILVHMGRRLKDVFEYIEGIFIDSGEKKVFNKAECKFGYRDSIFKQELKNKFVITSVVLRLNKKPVLKLDYGTVKEELEKLNLEKVTIKNVSDVICKIRQSKLPDPSQIGNAGSFFKNPEIETEKYSQLKKEFPKFPVIKWMIIKLKYRLAG